MTDKNRSLPITSAAPYDRTGAKAITEKKRDGYNRRNSSGRALSRAGKFFQSAIERQVKNTRAMSADSAATTALTRKLQCVVQRAWYDLEACSSQDTVNASLFSNAWDNLFSKIRYLKALPACPEPEPPFATAYWELNRRLLIARVERDDIALKNILELARVMSGRPATRFFTMGRALIDALYCETLLHLYDLIESRSTREKRIGLNLHDLRDRIIQHYPSLLSSFNNAFEMTRNEDEQNFPVYSLPLARTIKLIEERFEAECSDHRQNYLRHARIPNPGNAPVLSTAERLAVADELSGCNDSSISRHRLQAGSADI